MHLKGKTNNEKLPPKNKQYKFLTESHDSQDESATIKFKWKPGKFLEKPSWCHCNHHTIRPSAFIFQGCNHDRLMTRKKKKKKWNVCRDNPLLPQGDEKGVCEREGGAESPFNACLQRKPAAIHIYEAAPHSGGCVRAHRTMTYLMSLTLHL